MPRSFHSLSSLLKRKSFARLCVSERARESARGTGAAPRALAATALRKHEPEQRRDLRSRPSQSCAGLCARHPFRIPRPHPHANSHLEDGVLLVLARLGLDGLGEADDRLKVGALLLGRGLASARKVAGAYRLGLGVGHCDLRSAEEDTHQSWQRWSRRAPPRSAHAALTLVALTRLLMKWEMERRLEAAITTC